MPETRTRPVAEGDAPLTTALGIRRYLERWVGRERSRAERALRDDDPVQAHEAYAQAEACQQLLTAMMRHPSDRAMAERFYLDLLDARVKLDERLQSAVGAEAALAAELGVPTGA
jgi:hypothetical protein